MPVRGVSFDEVSLEKLDRHRAILGLSRSELIRRLVDLAYIEDMQQVTVVHRLRLGCNGECHNEAAK